MNVNSMFSLVDMLVVGCGLYVIYLCMEMKTKGKIRETMLLPRGLKVKNCKDVAEYIRRTWLKQLILGLLALGCGVAGLLQDLAGIVNSVVYLLCLLVFILYAVWYTTYMKKVIRKLW